MGRMSLSSPFRSSHRRTRSHSSLSSLSPSPVPRSINDQWRSGVKRAQLPQLQQPADGARLDLPSGSHSRDLASQPPEKWDVDMWRRGKRARRDPSGPLESVDMETSEDFKVASPNADLFTHTSAPSTPRLPSTSDAFQFFASKPFQSTKPCSTSQHLPGPFDDDLAQMHSDAFNDLRRSITRTGEGFVQRMRELEERRTRGGPSRASFGNCTQAGSRMSVKGAVSKRGRKRPSACASRPLRCDADGTYQADDDSDLEILSTRASGSEDGLTWSPSKKRAVSLGGLDLFRPHALPLSFAESPVGEADRERYSSPSDMPEYESAYTSDDDDEDMEDSESVRFRDTRFRQRGSSTTSTTPPLSFTFSSANSSMASLPLAAPITMAPTVTQRRASSKTKFMHSRRSGSISVSAHMPPPSATRSERAVAALSLALANGAGSVSDYEALRSVQGALAVCDRNTGDLWD